MTESGSGGVMGDQVGMDQLRQEQLIRRTRWLVWVGVACDPFAARVGVSRI